MQLAVHQDADALQQDLCALFDELISLREKVISGADLCLQRNLALIKLKQN